EPDLALTDEEIIFIGDQPLVAMHTPGHTPGSMSFLIGEQLFTGDTLFPGGPGATRFPYSDFDTIMRSLDERLFVLGDSTVVYPGHGMTTTLATERPHLEEWRARRW
ncbi:MAG: MBL fold metallo-hydrolase, partial [Acidimicrobiia bacterium]|nr:MBL fold metallo-hydrolase [Acidimicrobiia bacterium]